MKKFLQLTGLMAIMCLSFFYTEKAVEVVKEYDEIYQKISSIDDKYSVEPIDAVIDGNTIIPGISGKKINKDLSYSKMKRYGKYNESLIIFDKIKPNISISSNKDKFIISGNKENNFVSLLFLIKDDKTDIDYILKVLEEKKVNCDFFIDGSWAEYNLNYITKISSNHNIGNLSYNEDYNNSSFVWLDSIIKKNTKRNYTYCYSESNDTDIASICSKNNDYTVIPNIILKNNFLNNIKNDLEKGSIISISINDSNKQELPILINYILSKGFSIKPLNEHLDE